MGITGQNMGETGIQEAPRLYLRGILPRRVRALRDLLRWTQRRLAREAGINVGTVQQLESGLMTNPTLATLVRIASACHVRPGYLFAEEACLDCPVPGAPLSAADFLRHFGADIPSLRLRRVCQICQHACLPGEPHWITHCLLELAMTGHSPEFIAARTGVDIRLVRAALSSLEE